MTGIYPPASHALLVTEISPYTDQILQSYMDTEGVDVIEAVRALIEYGEMAWEIRRGTASDLNTSGQDSAGTTENEGMKWHRAL